MTFREIVSVQSSVQKIIFKVQSSSTYTVSYVVKEQHNFMFILLAHWDFPTRSCV